MKWTRHVMVLAWLVAGVLSVWAQGLLICGRCGREAQPGTAAVCSHCQAALPQPKVDNAPSPPPAPKEPDAATDVGRLAGGLVEASVRQAREAEAKQPELALAYYQNALALMRLVPSSTFPASVGEAILAGNARALQVLQRGAVPCRHCGGSGRYQLDLSKVDRRKGVKAIEGLPCAACKGAGTVPGFREVSKVKMLILQGRSEFERRQMVAGEVKVGRVLVPLALERLLTNRQRALIMTGMPLPCRDCQMSGRKLCTACRGSGWKTCDYTGCDNGALQEPRATGARKEKRLNEDEVKKCPRCEGLGEIPCAICKGSGGVVCSKCDGSGLAPRCTRCSGTGLMSCRICKGTGDVKGAQCPDCKGETMMLCPSCRGEGALSR